MSRKIQSILLMGAALLFAAQSTQAWTPSGQISKVVRLYMYEASVPPTIIQLENPTIYCYVPDSSIDNKKVINLLMALSISGKSAEFFCHDAEESVGGYPVHRLHRVTPV